MVADTFWRMSDVLRTDSPHGFAAARPRDAMITWPQPIDVPHGPDSPVGRIRDLDSHVLLLGVDHCCLRFALVDGWLEERGLQRRGTVGSAEARLCGARDAFAVVADHLAADETAFLHPFGVDEECDEARAILPAP